MEFRYEHKTYVGKLTYASYRFNDKIGFFDLCVKVEGLSCTTIPIQLASGSIWTGVEPWGDWSVRPVDFAGQ